MNMDLSSLWLEELIPEKEDEEFINNKLLQYVVDKSSSVATVDNTLSPESYTDTEYFRDTWLSRFEDQQIELMKPPAAATTYHHHHHQKTTTAAANYYTTRSQSIPNKTLGDTTTRALSSSNNMMISTSFTISFGADDPNHVPTKHHDDDMIPSFDHETAYGQGKLGAGPTDTQGHVLAERKRREKLNRQFVSLSSLLPNLKKMGRASVLEDATNYIKQLQERVKELEELTGVKRKDAKKCVIPLKRPRISSMDDDGSSSNDTNDSDVDSRVAGDVKCKSSSATEIEVQMSGNFVLVRIYSEKNSSLLVKVLEKMQSHGLSITSSSVMPFVNSTALIVVVAQIEGDFLMTAEDIVNNIQLVL